MVLSSDCPYVWGVFCSGKSLGITSKLNRTKVILRKFFVQFHCIEALRENPNPTPNQNYSSLQIQPSPMGQKYRLEVQMSHPMNSPNNMTLGTWWSHPQMERIERKIKGAVPFYESGKSIPLWICCQVEGVEGCGRVLCIFFICVCVGGGGGGEGEGSGGL